ncbi:hypothetical protein [Clostridium akagii]|uniref:hypothetical protein n=1 Tax=Clostridium akagii TaxID=91623 RepID=UPI000AD25A5B|nr:hypothetical protein [Clostridium akagii]
MNKINILMNLIKSSMKAKIIAGTVAVMVVGTGAVATVATIHHFDSSKVVTTSSLNNQKPKKSKKSNEVSNITNATDNTSTANVDNSSNSVTNATTTGTANSTAEKESNKVQTSNTSNNGQQSNKSTQSSPTTVTTPKSIPKPTPKPTPTPTPTPTPIPTPKPVQVGIDSNLTSQLQYLIVSGTESYTGVQKNTFINIAQQVALNQKTSSEAISQISSMNWVEDSKNINKYASGGNCKIETYNVRCNKFNVSGSESATAIAKNQFDVGQFDDVYAYRNADNTVTITTISVNFITTPQ